MQVMDKDEILRIEMRNWDHGNKWNKTSMQTKETNANVLPTTKLGSNYLIVDDDNPSLHSWF